MTESPAAASLHLRYRIWHEERYVDASDYLADVDGYLKQAFMDPGFRHSGGLLIEVGGRPWNSHETFDTVLNMANWLTAAAVLAAGEQRTFDVWAWEESRCLATRLSDGLLRLEDPPLLPPVVIGFRDFVAELREPGAELLELQRRAAARLAELCQGTEEGELPAVAHEWAGELPDEYVDERVVRRMGPLVEVRGWSIEHRWMKVAGIPMSAGDLDRLAQDLVALEGYLVATR